MNKNKTNMWLLVCILVFSVPAKGLAEDANTRSGFVKYDLASVDERLEIDTAWRRVLEAEIARAINPNDYVCDPATDFVVWASAQFAAIDPFSLFVLNVLGGFFWAGDAKILIDNDASDEHIGVQGQYTREQIKRHKDNRRFWDVRSDDILLMGMHGAQLSDAEKMLEFLSIPFIFQGIPEEGLVYIIELVQTTIEGGVADFGLFFSFPSEPPGPLLIEMPGIPNGYDNPVLTLNAFAFSTGGAEIPYVGLIPDKIVMGDGILEGLEAIGLGQNAPDFVHAHEFAHHVQFEIGAFDSNLPPPEGTRRTELMADGFAAYYSTHARGATMQAKRFAEVMNAAFVVGDCQFDSFGHHGTPNQRDAAAAWGGQVSSSARKQGHIESAYTMLTLFDAELPNLVAPDVPR